MYLCAQNHDLKRGGTFETAKAGTFHSVTAGTSIPLFTQSGGLRKNWVTNWRPYSIPHSAINCVKEHPTVSHQPYYGSSSGAKVIILFQSSKSIHTFFFRACSLFLQSLWHLMWHLPERCVLGYVLLPNICAVSHPLGTLT